MIQPSDEVTDEQREHCALINLRHAASEYARRESIPFEEAFFLFCKSPAYQMLFDYETGLWKEGPRYLFDLFQRG